MSSSVGQYNSTPIIEPSRDGYQSRNTFGDHVDSCCAVVNDCGRAAVDRYIDKDRQVARNAGYKAVDSLTDCSADCLKKTGGCAVEAQDATTAKEQQLEIKTDGSSWWKFW